MSKGRKRQNIALTLPSCIFVTLRNIGIRDAVLAKETGIARSTVSRIAAGAVPTIDLSHDEFARLQAFAAEKLAGAEDAVAMLDLWEP